MAVKDERSTPMESEETLESAGLDETQETKSKEADAITEEVTEEADKETEPSKKESEPLETEEEAEEIDIDDLIKGEDKDEHKSGYEKRIDKLTARNKANEEELRSIKDKLTKYEAKESVETGKYTPEQLRKALKKGMDNGDSEVVWDIIDYMKEQTKEEIRKEYLAEQGRMRKQQQDVQAEWTEVVNNYKDYADSENELYAGSSKDLNILDPKSLLAQTAVRLYNAQQENLFQRYHRPGGQELAVADALQLILKKKRGNPPKDKEKDLLKRKLAKEKRKSSLGSGSPGVEAKSSRPMNAQERLDEYLKERKAINREI